MQQPPQLVPHLVSTARPMPILHPMAIFQPILSKLLTPNNLPTPLQAAIVRQLFVRIRMRTNQCPIHSTPFRRRPIPIPFVLGIPHAQADHLLLPQYKRRRRPQMPRAVTLWQCEALPIHNRFPVNSSNRINVQRVQQGEGLRKIQHNEKWSSLQDYLQFPRIDMQCWG